MNRKEHHFSFSVVVNLYYWCYLRLPWHRGTIQKLDTAQISIRGFMQFVLY